VALVGVQSSSSAVDLARRLLAARLPVEVSGRRLDEVLRDAWRSIRRGTDRCRREGKLMNAITSTTDTTTALAATSLIFESAKVETVTLDGDVWFLASDVCNGLRLIDNKEGSSIRPIGLPVVEFLEMPLKMRTGLYGDDNAFGSFPNHWEQLFKNSPPFDVYGTASPVSSLLDRPLNEPERVGVLDQRPHLCAFQP
jgi:hypothetical protein